MISRRASLIVALWLLAAAARACELCAIYSADNARPDAGRGWVATVSEQFTQHHTLQFAGREVHVADPDYLDESMTHLVAGYNFSGRFGLSLNTPFVHRDYKRSAFHPPFTFVREAGTVSGLGDASLVARFSALRHVEMESAAVLNLLAGVKFPTGDTQHIRNEVAASRVYDTFFPPGHTAHDINSFSAVHEHMLSPGSGSFDGVFGATLATRWRRCFFNAQFQYYLRTPGEAGFEFGDEVLISGGPGAYLLLRDACTLSLAFNGYYESETRVRIDGRPSDHTGMTAWYVGPQLTLTLGEHFSLNAGADLPLHVGNYGFQAVPDWRAHGGLSWRF
ncbi:MAG: hypothetical protein HY301_14290 [Verrucomicrobia bacterium]|nr:hypothetical protein [Verrucomicrobiota bacterium]